MLCLYAKQIAWLHGTPKTKGKDEKFTRLEKLEKQGEPIELPNIAPVRYLVDWLNDVGWSQAGGMGSVPISAQELWAWSQLNRLKLEEWEVRVMRQASRSYVAQSYSESNIAPYVKPKAKSKLLGKFIAIAKQVNKT